MAKCSFCGEQVGKGTGTLYITTKGKTMLFCSSKCERNLIKLKRKPRKTKWSREYIEEKRIRVKSSEKKETPQKKQGKEGKKVAAKEPVEKEKTKKQQKKGEGKK